jgi:uncharacterized protein YjbI with pentapeptide repeats
MLCHHSPMPQQPIVQPLPQNLQNWSFKGLDCSGWDFSGRNIRGCNFLGCNLTGVNFSNCNAGRSKAENNRSILTMILSVGLSTAFVARLFFGWGLQKYSSTMTEQYLDKVHQSNQSIILITGIIFFAAMLSLMAIDIIVASTTICTVILFAFIGSFILSAVNLGGSAWGLALILLFVIFIPVGIGKYYFPLFVRNWKNLIGTNFQGANLRGADFTNANLSNCLFNQADVSNVNWANVAAKNCQGLTDVSQLDG